MMQQLVITDGDTEIDWVDPVLTLEYGDGVLKVWNGWYLYQIELLPGQDWELRNICSECGRYEDE